MPTNPPISSTFDWAEHPPGPVILATKALDIFLSPFVGEWRSNVPDNWSWVQHKYDVASCTHFLLPLQTYGDYVANNSLDYYSFSSLYSYAFKTESTSLGVVTTPTSIMVLFILVMCFRMANATLLPFFSSIGRRAGRRTHGLEWEKNNEIRIQKFGEYVFRLLYHFIIAVYGVYTFTDKIWWDETRGGTANLFLGFPFHPVEPDMAWYYLIQSAYNLEAFIRLFELSFQIKFLLPSAKTYYLPFSIGWSPTVRGDFREMCIHHIVTNMLIIGSSFFRLTRVGSMVFMVHDLSDIPVDLSKLANFLKWKAATAACFGTMVLFWLIFRLGMLPFVILKSSIYNGHLVLETGVTPLDCFVVYRSFFVALVIAIVMLHAAWFSMFIQMGYLLIFKGETHDLSEHKKGEDQTIVSNGSKKKAE
ncbi:TRAM-like protein [Fragilaria crotonensis]|nr:TRAM-like protein [Fragilaria crotonensis]